MRTFGVAARLIRQILHDKRTLALLFVAPLFVLWLISLAFNGSSTKAIVDVVNGPAPFVTQLQKTDATVHLVSLQTASDDVQNQKADGYVQFDQGAPKIVLEGSDPTRNAAVLQTVQVALGNLSGPAHSLPVTYVHGGSSLTRLDYFAPVFIGFFIFFFVFLISGISFLRERTSGTLERMLATPVRRFEIVLGYFVGFGLFALLQTVVVQSFALYVLGVHSVGGFGEVLVVNAFLASVALSLGSLLSAFANNEFQIMQFLPIVVVPQVFLCGLFDLRGFPTWLMDLSNVLPLTFAVNALRALMIRGQSLANRPTDLLALGAYAATFLLLNIVILRRYRKV